MSLTADPNPGPPLRVLVKGGSSAVAVSPRPSPVEAFQFARWVEVLLNKSGWPGATVLDTSEEGHLVRHAIYKWHETECIWNPDVVILNLGMYECVHLFLPHWLERLANRSYAHRAPWRSWLRRRAIRPLWRRAAGLQRRVDRRLSPALDRRLSRTLLDLNGLIDDVLANTDRLVLVTDLWPITDPWMSWFPGLPARLDSLQDKLVSAINRRGNPHVRIVSVRAIVQLRELEESLPDGMHYAPWVHRTLADALVAEIGEWIETNWPTGQLAHAGNGDD